LQSGVSEHPAFAHSNSHPGEIMISSSDQFTASNKAFFQSQLATFHELTRITMQGTEKVVALNMAAIKASTDESADAVKRLLAAKDPQAFLALASSYAKPNTEKVTAYNHHLTDIVSATKDELTKVAEAQAAEVRSKVNDFVNTIAKSAPAGAESAIALLKSSVANANSGYEKMHDITKEAVDATEAHAAKASQHLTKVVHKAADK
jgi:phasin family protein